MQTPNDSPTTLPRVGRAHGSPSREQKGRVCDLPQCDTILTSYNLDEVCYKHAGLAPYAPSVHTTRS